MKSTNPIASIVIPTFNRAGIIAETLDSVINQSFPDWECLIVDDSSTDNTEAVVSNFIEKDNRFKFHQRPRDKNKGANSCRNYGLELAKGEFIHWLDSDDIVHPRYLETCIRYIERENTEFCRFSRELFYGNFHYNFPEISATVSPKPIGVEQLESMLRNELEFNTCNVVWKRKTIGTERFNEDIVYADEWEFYSRLLSNGIKGISIDQVMLFGRKHKDSTTSEFRAKDPVRRASKITAIKLVLKNLKEKNLLSPSLTHYFIQLGFLFREPSVIKLALKLSDSNFLVRMKYRIGFSLYPIIRPVLVLKGNFKKVLK